MTEHGSIQIRECDDSSEKWKRVIASNGEREAGFEIPMAEWKGSVPREKIYQLVRSVFCRLLSENSDVLRMPQESLPHE